MKKESVGVILKAGWRTVLIESGGGGCKEGETCCIARERRRVVVEQTCVT